MPSICFLLDSCFILLYIKLVLFTGMKKYIVPAAVFVIVLMLSNITFALLLAASVPLIFSYLKRKKKQTAEKVFEKQFIESLRLILSTLRSGQTMLQSFEEAARRSASPVSLVYNDVLASHRLGKSLDEALLETVWKLQNEDIKLFAIVVSIMKDSGGNTVSLISNMLDSCEERVRLSGKIEALTAQGRLSGLVVGLLPVALLIIFWFLDPKLIYPLFHSQGGFILLSVAAALEAAGIYFIAKITNIEV